MNKSYRSNTSQSYRCLGNLANETQWARRQNPRGWVPGEMSQQTREPDQEQHLLEQALQTEDHQQGHPRLPLVEYQCCRLTARQTARRQPPKFQRR